METLLRVEALTKTFGRTVANDAVSLEVGKGELHCLLGENGAGKSTLSECLYGYYRPDSGRIFFKGRAVAFASPNDAIRLGIGMVHQHFVLVETLTVLENIILGDRGQGFILDLGAARERVRALCAGYDINLDLDAPVHLLSVGEQQWVEILKVLYLGAELLILDEPTAVLTPPESARLFAILRRMTAEGLAVILITHKLNEVMQSDRVTVLRRGRNAGSAETAAVTRQELTQMMIGRPLVSAAERQAVAAGRPVLEVRGLTAMHERGHRALDGISFELRRNEILGLAGVAGNGQKELFEVLAGVRRPTGGSVLLDGADVTGLAPREIIARGMGYIPDDRFKAGLIADFSIAENLILGKQATPAFSHRGILDARAIHRYAGDCIDAYGIAVPSAEAAVGTLSGGNAQRVIIAREFRQSSRCLLCNQPTRGLDVGVIEYVHHQLLAKRDEGLGILLASEELEEIFALSDRIAVIFKGRIVGVFAAADADFEEIGQLMAGMSPTGLSVDSEARGHHRA